MYLSADGGGRLSITPLEIRVDLVSKYWGLNWARHHAMEVTEVKYYLKQLSFTRLFNVFNYNILIKFRPVIPDQPQLMTVIFSVSFFLSLIKAWRCKFLLVKKLFEQFE